MSGVFAVDRRVFDHPMFAPEPYTEREAWLWLVGAAAWKDTRARVGRHMLDLKRGQCAFALRFMATKWKWAEARVRRFLTRLKTDAMIVVAATRETTLITICNYERYAFGRRTVDAQTDAQTDAPTDAPATHQRRKEEESKNLKKDDDVAEREPLISEAAFQLADEVAVIVGHDLAFVPPAWHGAAMRVQKWLTTGWGREIILASVREQMARRGAEKPDRVAYFEKGIAAAISRQDRPLPAVNVIEGETVNVARKSENLVDTAKRLTASGISFGERPQPYRGRKIADPARLLPAGRGERS